MSQQRSLDCLKGDAHDMTHKLANGVVEPSDLRAEVVHLEHLLPEHLQVTALQQVSQVDDLVDRVFFALKHNIRNVNYIDQGKKNNKHISPYIRQMFLADFSTVFKQNSKFRGD